MDFRQKPARRGDISTKGKPNNTYGTDGVPAEENTPTDRISFSNLAHLEIQLDDPEPSVFREETSQASCAQLHGNDIVEESPVVNGDRVSEGRTRRLRKQLHNVGRMGGREREKKEY